MKLFRMKATAVILFLALVVFTQSCEKKEECYTCFTPPEPFTFEIVDKSTGENLFTKGTFESSQIEVVDLDDDRDLEFEFIDENNVNLIQLDFIGWNTEVVDFSVNIAGETIFTMHADTERKSEDCCSFTVYNEVKIENAEFEYGSHTGIYKILLQR